MLTDDEIRGIGQYHDAPAIREICARLLKAEANANVFEHLAASRLAGIAHLETRVKELEGALVEIRNMSVLPRGRTKLIAGSAAHINPDEVLRRLQRAVSISEAVLEEGK